MYESRTMNLKKVVETLKIVANITCEFNKVCFTTIILQMFLDCFVPRKDGA